MANSGAVKQTNQKREKEKICISQILRKNECQSCDKTGVKMCVDMKICIQLPYNIHRNHESIVINGTENGINGQF